MASTWRWWAAEIQPARAALHVASFARQVTLLVRHESLQHNMSDYLVQQIRNTPRIDVRLGVEVVGGAGDEPLETLIIRSRTDGVREGVQASLVFVLIGAAPRTDWLEDMVQRDTKGVVCTGNDVNAGGWPSNRKPMPFETSLPGVVAVGDVRLGSMKCVASAVGEGAGAIQNIHRYLEAQAAMAASDVSARDAVAA